MNKKVLCLGNNTIDTSNKTKQLSLVNKSCHHGLLSRDSGSVNAASNYQAGYYHSSVYDMDFEQLLSLSDKFDQVVILDQPMNQWSHSNAFYQTLNLSIKTKTPVLYLNKSLIDRFNFFSSLIEKNKSFCIFPFIELLVNYDYTTVCCRSATPITKIDNLKDYQRDPEYTKIRSKMLAGELLPEHCQACYSIEQQGVISARQQETIEWVHRLDLKNLADVTNLPKPSYYEIRPSNKCNLMCRSCSPNNSNLIEKEYLEIGLIDSISSSKKHQTMFELIDFEYAKKIYVAGGEPTVMPEFYDFLTRCIREGKTDLEISVNTNGTHITNKFKELLPHFTNLNFIFSIDGFGTLNHYIRWPSKWDTIIKNWQYLVDHSHHVAVNTTVSIYNVSSLHKLYKFIDHNFPSTPIHCSLADGPKFFSPFMFPNQKLVLDSLEESKNHCVL